MSIFKKAAAFLTAVGIACSAAACGYNTINALTIEGMDVPAGVYIYYLNAAKNTAMSKLAEENPDLDTTDDNAVKASTLEGKDITSWIQDEATKSCARYVLIEKDFDDLGLELDADSKSTIDTMMDYYWSNSQEMMEKNGVSEASFRKIVTSSYKSEQIYEHYYGIGGTEGVTEDDVRTYYLENNIRCEYLALDLKDGEGNLLKSEGKKEIMAMAEDYQKSAEAALKSGGIDGVKEEMDAIRQDYQMYVDALAASTEDADAEGTDAEPETVGETAAETTKAETTTKAEATTKADDAAEETTTKADDAAETTEEQGEAHTEVVEEAPLAEAMTAAEEETTGTTSAEETTEETTEAAADSEADEETKETDETAGEDETTEETEEASDEDDTIEEIPDLDTLTTGADEEETDPFANEQIIAVIHTEDYDDPEDIYYNPSENVYNKLAGIEAKDYGKVYIVEDDEAYYLVVRYDIEERMSEDDLWTESTIDNTVYQMNNKKFQDDLDTRADSANVQRNDAAYKRYDPFKLNFE